MQAQQPAGDWSLSGSGGHESLSYTEYDALGRVVKQSVPYLITKYVYQTANGKIVTPYRTPDAAQPTTLTRYDPNGQALRAPDGNATVSYQVGRTGIGIDANGQRRDQISDAYGNLVQVYEYNNAPQTYEAEATGYHQVGSASGGAWLSPSGSGSAYLTYGPYQAPGAVGPGQLALFRLAINSVSGANDIVVRIEAYDASAGQIFASRELRRYEFVGGLSAFSEFGLTFDTSGRTGHTLEYRVLWYGTAQVAHDRTRLSWTANRNSTQYTYDVLGNLKTVTDAAGNVTSIDYDSLSRKTGMDDPDMGQWYYAYDNAGNLTRQTDARGQRICFYYDALNRLTGKHYRTNNSCPTSNPTLNVSYSYDAGTYGKGRRTGMSDASGSTTWTYDARGQVTQTLQTINGGGQFRTQWGYDSMDRMVWMKYPENNGGGTLGEQVNFTYNVQGQVNGVAAGAVPYVSSSAYDEAGRLTQRVYGSSTLYNTYTYYPWTTANGQGRLQALKTGVSAPPNNTSLQSLAYTYDAVGNVLSIVDYKAGGTQTQSFTYDPLNRLKTATASGGSGGTYSTQTYFYNTIGNLTSKDGYQYGYEPAHPHAVTVLLGASYPINTYAYDPNGNQITRNLNGSLSTLTYDAENRLTAVSGATSASFVYDGDGARVKTVMGGVTTTYVGNYFEWTGNTSTMVKYYYAGSQRVAMRKGSTLTYLLGDHLGSTSKTYVNSTTTTEQRYHPWGGTRYGSSPTAFQYTGQRNDSAINLYY
ncbi:MAG: RHS repeat protein [Anaerolineae bacterium]|nr:RHS repeat protein [Anaerolineae bacterium]